MNPALYLFILPLLMAALGLNPRAGRWLPRVAAALMLLQVGVAAALCGEFLRTSGAAVATLDGVGQRLCL